MRASGRLGALEAALALVMIGLMAALLAALAALDAVVGTALAVAVGAIVRVEFGLARAPGRVLGRRSTASKLTICFSSTLRLILFSEHLLW